MSLKFDKVFIKGLLKTDEQNQALFLAPIISSILGVIGIGIVCWLFLVSATHQTPTDLNLIVWSITGLSGAVGIMIFSDLNIYSQEKLIPQLSPEDCVPNKNGVCKKILLLKMPILSSILPLLISMIYLNCIENGVLSVYELLRSFGCYIFVIFIAQAFVKYGMLDAIQPKEDDAEQV